MLLGGVDNLFVVEEKMFFSGFREWYDILIYFFINFIISVKFYGIICGLWLKLLLWLLEIY